MTTRSGHTPEISVRKARAGDVSLLVKLEKEFDQDEREIVLKEDPRLKPYLRRTSARFSSARMRKWVAARNTAVFIAEVDSIPCGFIVAFIATSPAIFEPKRYGFIGIMFVQREYRGRGIGSLMYEEGLRWLANRNIKHVGLTVMRENKQARRIYEKWGFRDFTVSMWKLD